MSIPFSGFPKIHRLSRPCVITEKIDGTNAQIHITEDNEFYVGSRKRWLTPEDDNFGFAAWAYENKEELMELGVGAHFGEWWGKGIQRKYDMDERVFSLFNADRWEDDTVRPSCCSVVPVLYRGMFTTEAAESALFGLWDTGSRCKPHFPKPEGIVIYHYHSGVSFKKTLEKDEVPKGTKENTCN